MSRTDGRNGQWSKWGNVWMNLNRWEIKGWEYGPAEGTVINALLEERYGGSK